MKQHPDLMKMFQDMTKTKIQLRNYFRSQLKESNIYASRKYNNSLRKKSYDKQSIPAMKQNDTILAENIVNKNSERHQSRYNDILNCMNSKYGHKIIIGSENTHPRYFSSNNDGIEQSHEKSLLDMVNAKIHLLNSVGESSDQDPISIPRRLEFRDPKVKNSLSPFKTCTKPKKIDKILENLSLNGETIKNLKPYEIDDILSHSGISKSSSSIRLKKSVMDKSYHKHTNTFISFVGPSNIHPKENIRSELINSFTSKYEIALSTNLLTEKTDMVNLDTIRENNILMSGKSFVLGPLQSTPQSIINRLALKLNSTSSLKKPGVLHKLIESNRVSVGSHNNLGLFTEGSKQYNHNRGYSRENLGSETERVLQSEQIVTESNKGWHSQRGFKELNNSIGESLRTNSVLRPINQRINHNSPKNNNYAREVMEFTNMTGSETNRKTDTQKIKCINQVPFISARELNTNIVSHKNFKDSICNLELGSPFSKRQVDYSLSLNAFENQPKASIQIDREDKVILVASPKKAKALITLDDLDNNNANISLISKANSGINNNIIGICGLPSLKSIGAIENTSESSGGVVTTGADNTTFITTNQPNDPQLIGIRALNSDMMNKILIKHKISNKTIIKSKHNLFRMKPTKPFLKNLLYDKKIIEE